MARLEEHTAQLQHEVQEKKTKLTKAKAARDEMIERMQKLDAERREHTEDQVSRELQLIKERAEAQTPHCSWHSEPAETQSP